MSNESLTGAVVFDSGAKQMAGPYQTSYRLWALLAGALFALFGFAPVVGGKGTTHSVWGLAWELVQGPFDSSEVAGLTMLLLFYAVLLAAPALAFGWIAQAVVVVVVSVFRGRSAELRGPASEDKGSI
jgi:hypothetical protein